MELPVSVYIVLGTVILTALGRHLIKKGEEQIDIDRQKDDYTRMVKSQKDREIVARFDEDRFWNIIEEVLERSGSSYRNFLGLFKDKVRTLPEEEIIMLDNLLIKLYRENLTFDLYAASTIIFKSEDLINSYLLMNVFMTKGRVFFKQACKSPELVLGKSFEDVDGRLINDVLSELYFAKTKELMPIPVDEEWDIPGEKWKFRDLPEKYPELWAAFN
ncbi:hypothetical protein Oweho_2943 [Owenweeksia hongkongensis DSM 17368]|uniref:DUF4240 domain-containing protein n=1 Tax=Owenweeksia hongkongensis (strain DSM 17368 / CIP 108786 / JCM 12287 / NRRL B-23963 / UST20020801) TaxID=926562 RepID=G8R1F7_OWEHD|nr:DUF4240 domain-containing protein [Owenweeksia hongkongensis]AEV33900.1 hypothetical protein Oweho_2943 [Owenweeksia hongkongensis DSM 17368]